jgi:hypothetical protein
MALEMKFSSFVTPELHITAGRHGALMVTLGSDGSAHGCVASRGHDGAAGQYHYERDPAKREPYRGTSDAIVDGIAELVFDQIAWGTCDPAKAVAATPIELRCIATATTAMLPDGALVCRSSRAGDPFGLGMPLGTAITAPPSSAPTGMELLLAPAGILVTYTDESSTARKIKITSHAVAIDPAAFAK